MLLRTAIPAALVAAFLVGAPDARAGIVEHGGAEDRIRFLPSPNPPAFTLGVHDFTLLAWIRREPAPIGGVQTALAFGTALSVAFDDDAGAVRFALHGIAGDLVADVAPPGGVPAGAWMLIAMSHDEAARRLDAWVASPATGIATATAANPAWTPLGAAWPPRFGATGAGPGFVGQLGLVVARGHPIDATDVALLWNDGAPHYFGPARLDAGSLDGFAGVQWMTGHGIITSPGPEANPLAQGAQLGDVVTPHNVLAYSVSDASDLFSSGRLVELTGTWTLHSPHETGRSWSGFFVREAADDLDLPDPPATRLVAPLSRILALDEPTGLVRVIASANSRAARTTGGGWYDGLLENWAHGGIYGARRASVAGVIVPAPRCTCTDWPAFRGAGRTIGDVADSAETTRPSASFGNFGSHGDDNPAFPGYDLVGAAIVIEEGSAFVPKARPESGTRFAEATEPLVVRAMVLEFPGSGSALAQGEKATSQNAAGSPFGEAVLHALDTTTHEAALGAGATIDPGRRLIVLPGAHDAIAIGDGCFVAEGPGADGISVVTDVVRSRGATTIALERWFPVSPGIGSTLAFGPVAARWIEQPWPGLAAGDPQVFRGLRLDAVGGPVALLYLECHAPGADGFIVGGFGRSGRGYAQQLDAMFDETGAPAFAALAADVWLQFFAHQGSPPESMDAFAEVVRAAQPNVELWWCGDPDLDAAIDGQTEGTDPWQHYILEQAPALGIGAIAAQAHPTVGTGNERAADGQTASRSHPTSRGCRIYVEAVLDLMRDAALPGTAPCPADLDGSGDVGFGDLVLLLGAWGASESELDLDRDGLVGFGDLLLLLGTWGPC